VLPLEIVALLLTAAMIGAVVLAMRERAPSEPDSVASGKSLPGSTKEERLSPLQSYLSVATLLFAIGLAGALTRRNAIVVLIGVELMLNGANLNFIAFWRYGSIPTQLPVSSSCCFRWPWLPLKPRWVWRW